MENFQRTGSHSNARVGKDFEVVAQKFFKTHGIDLVQSFRVPVGIRSIKKLHAFDLGSEESRVLIECKSHKWTSGNNVPSAKMTVWNEAMYYFTAAPPGYRMILFVLKDISESRNESLASYYIRTYGHLIPSGVEIWEYDERDNTASQLASCRA